MRSLPRAVFRVLLAALSLSLFVAVPGVSFAQRITMGPVEFDPASFVPGEPVALYVRIDPGAASWRPETMMTGFDESEGTDPRILYAALEDRKGEPLLVLRFVPWRAGTGFVPAVSIGGLEVPPIEFDCASALDATDARPPMPQPQLTPPDLYARLYVAGGVFLLLSLVATFALAKARPWMRAVLARWSFARPRREFDALLATLGAAVDDRTAWAELCAGLRRFVRARTGADWSALTASEVAALPEAAEAGSVALMAASVFATADAARFAGTRGLDLAAAIDAAREIAATLDETCAPGAVGAVR